MFTGLVQQVGQIRRRESAGRGAKLEIACTFDGLEIGESVATDGVCLTVARETPGGFIADLSAETVNRTSLRSRAVGSRVNLERAVRMQDRLGGHLVSGHVDGIVRVSSVELVGEAQRLCLRYPGELAAFIAAKGSVTLDGVSLTVNAVSEESFEVMVVPHTWARTTLSGVAEGSELNLEVDVVARYVARLLQVGAAETTAEHSNDERLRSVLQRAGLL